MKNEKVLLKFQQAELDAVLMYQRMAARVKAPEAAAGLKAIAEDEGRHAAVLFRLTRKSLKPKKALANLVVFAMSVIGEKALFPIIAKQEYAAVDRYAPFTAEFPELAEVRQDEAKHGDKITELMKLL